LPDPRDARALDLLAEAIADELWQELIEEVARPRVEGREGDARQGAPGKVKGQTRTREANNDTG
jgi:hypothetical protein